MTNKLKLSKENIVRLSVSILITLLLVSCSAYTKPLTTPALNNGLVLNKEKTMKLNAGIITDKLQATKDFYSEVLNFSISFENEFYLLMHTPNKSTEISFLMPNHPSQKPIFQTPFDGNGVYLTIEVDDVDAVYEQIKAKGVLITIDIRDEPWGDRHFAIADPNGIGIDIVSYTKPVG